MPGTERPYLLHFGIHTLADTDLELVTACSPAAGTRAVPAEVRRRADQLPKDSGPRALADVVLRETERVLLTYDQVRAYELPLTEGKRGDPG